MYTATISRLATTLLRVLALGAMLTTTARAEEIVVSNYGATVNGMPYAVAKALGYFEQEGANVTGILSSSGGGTTIRNLLGGNLAYGESSLASIVAAAQKGAKLKIISGNAHTVAEFFWIVMPDSPIKSIDELKGKRLGFTNPRSTSQALDILLVGQLGLGADAVELVKTGGFSPMLVALEEGGIDVAPMADPMYTKNKTKYRVLTPASAVLPALTNVVGVTTEDAASTKGDFIRAVLRARRRAVEYIYFNPNEAAKLIAPEYNLDEDTTREVLYNLIASTTSGGVPYWGPGDIRYAPMDAMIKAQKDVGAIEGDVDWSTLVDEQFLPDDLRSRR
ncbi:MAG: ABC transporter substrate-binding protein [Ectothiorhodospiraceae bacterium]|nr:ABC transporter substrate-binding protein [Ectothiorhodospiraceae bacterium]